MILDKYSDERLKLRLFERVLEFESFNVEFVIDKCLEIIKKMIFVLEWRLMKYFEEIKIKLLDYLCIYNVGLRFFEVNVIFRRLK